MQFAIHIIHFDCLQVYTEVQPSQNSGNIITRHVKSPQRKPVNRHRYHQFEP